VKYAFLGYRKNQTKVRLKFSSKASANFFSKNVLSSQQKLTQSHVASRLLQQRVTYLTVCLLKKQIICSVTRVLKTTGNGMKKIQNIAGSDHLRLGYQLIPCAIKEEMIDVIVKAF